MDGDQRRYGRGPDRWTDHQNGHHQHSSAGVTNAMLAKPFRYDHGGLGTIGGGTVALGNTITLTNTAPSLGGTVTSVASGTGLTGGPITSSGTLSLNTPTPTVSTCSSREGR